MALLLRESEVERLLDMPTALEAVEEVLRQHGQGQAQNQPRRRVFVPGGALHVMSGGMPGWGVMGLKAYAAVKGKVRFVVLLFSTETGELLALIEADRLGQMRTGAASGVATKYMARPDAGVVGIFGTGWQAQTQLQAVCAVRTIREVRVYGRDLERRKRFSADMERRLGCAVRPVDSPEQVVQGRTSSSPSPRPGSRCSTAACWSRASTSTWPGPTWRRSARWTTRRSAGPTASW